MLRGGIVVDAVNRLYQLSSPQNLHARNRALALIGDMANHSDEAKAVISGTPGLIQALISISCSHEEHLFTKDAALITLASLSAQESARLILLGLGETGGMVEGASFCVDAGCGGRRGNVCGTLDVMLAAICS